MYYYDRAEVVVDLTILRHNLENIKRELAKDALLCPIIKTDAYGHGMLQAAQAARGLADYFAVATVEEALLLRKSGVEEPVFLLGFLPKERIGELFDWEIYPNVFHLETAEALSKEAVRRGRQLPIHVSVDTGMSRLGFSGDAEGLSQVETLSHLPGLFLEGIFSHFAAADTADKTLARQQIMRFERFVAELEKRGVHFRLRHMAASAAAMECEEARYDMIRSGIINYGIYPSDEVARERVEVLPCLSLLSRVVNLRQIPAGASVSYGATYTADRPRRIATIPVGYGDGYFRLLSGKGRVLIRGKSAPILGRICMDQFMVDVSEIPGVQIGDRVTLIGQDGEEEITADELAALTGTIAYEIVCDLGKRLPRVYLENGVVSSTRDFFDR